MNRQEIIIKLKQDLVKLDFRKCMLNMSMNMKSYAYFEGINLIKIAIKDLGWITWKGFFNILKIILGSYKGSNKIAFDTLIIFRHKMLTKVTLSDYTIDAYLQEFYWKKNDVECLSRTTRDFLYSNTRAPRDYINKSDMPTTGYIYKK
jgi:hypothetical protein